jgi:hypothetical protein
MLRTLCYLLCLTGAIVFSAFDIAIFTTICVLGMGVLLASNLPHHPALKHEDTID